MNEESEDLMTTFFCPECHKEVTYTLGKDTINKTIRGKEYSFEITAARCDHCGEALGLPGMIDQNVKEIDDQYRKKENIISIESIEKLMEVYNLGKSTLSLALGFGEITISRYLDGQVPSQEYSDRMKRALRDPAFMKEMLLENKDKIAESSYRKAMKAIDSYTKSPSISPKMKQAISAVFQYLDEVTPLMLQKLLYYIQGFFLALYNQPLYEEDCEAWIHGPVYRNVYDIFKDYKYNPIDDPRFCFYEDMDKNLSEEEENVIRIVCETFGVYSGKTLERLTHKETPWQNARCKVAPGIPSREIISKADIKSYFDQIARQYPLTDPQAVFNYIQDLISVGSLADAS